MLAGWAPGPTRRAAKVTRYSTRNTFGAGGAEEVRARAEGRQGTPVLEVLEVLEVLLVLTGRCKQVWLVHARGVVLAVTISVRPGRPQRVRLLLSFSSVGHSSACSNRRIPRELKKQKLWDLSV